MQKKDNHISAVAMVAGSAIVIGYMLLIYWISSRYYFTLAHCVAALLAYGIFCTAVVRLVAPIEDMWNLERTSIDVKADGLIYLMIIIFAAAVNLFIIAAALVKSPGTPILSALENLYAHIDTKHYLEIAEKWYVNDSTDLGYNIVFLPLYPMLIKIITFITGNYLVSALLISNALAILCGIVFHKLALMLTGPNDAAAAMKLLYIFPSAFFFFVPMTESLFLFLSLVCFYYALKKNYIAVSVAGALLTLTKIQSIVFLVPIAMEIITDLRSGGKPESRQYLRLLSLLSFLFGLFIYMLVNKAVYGNYLQFLAAEKEHWSQGVTYFWNTPAYMVDYFRGWIKEGRTTFAFALELPNILAFFCSIGFIAYGARKTRPSIMMYGLAYFAVSYGATWLLSGPRYAACLFPLALIAAKPAARKKLYNAIFTSIYAIAYVLYLHTFLFTGIVY